MVEARLRRDRGRLDVNRRAADRNRELVEAYRRNRHGGFERIVREYVRDVTRVAARFGLSRNEVEDVSQEVFLRVWRGLRGFRGEASLRSWILRIAVRESSRQMSRRRRQEVPLEAAEGAASPEEAPAEMASQLEQRTRLREVLKALSDKHRQVLVLRYLEGMSCREVAELLGCSVGTVHSRLYHARQKLKDVMKVR